MKNISLRGAVWVAVVVVKLGYNSKLQRIRMEIKGDVFLFND